MKTFSTTGRSTTTVNTEHSVKAAVALSYIPCLLAQLDDTGRAMLADVLQAMRDGGYEDGFADAVQHQKEKEVRHAV